MILLGQQTPVRAERIEPPVIIPRNLASEKSSPSASSVPVNPQPAAVADTRSGAIPPPQPVVPPPPPPPQLPPVEQEVTPAPAPEPVISNELILAPAPAEPELFFASSGSPTGLGSGDFSLTPLNGAIKSGAISPQSREKEEMYTRMRLAVERIAAEYGNPTFGQFFTNDKIRAQVIRNRLQLLQNYEALLSEISALEKKKSVIAQEVDAVGRQKMEQLRRELSTLETNVSSQKNELKTLREQSSLLRERIVQAQKALSMIGTGE